MASIMRSAIRKQLVGGAARLANKSVNKTFLIKCVYIIYYMPFTYYSAHLP